VLILKGFVSGEQRAASSGEKSPELPLGFTILLVTPTRVFWRKDCGSD